jgi:hypothetical protein
VTSIYLETSAFTATGWEKAFYPAGLPMFCLEFAVTAVLQN